MVFHGFSMFQRIASKTLPKLQNTSKIAPKYTKLPPKCSQDAPKRLPRASQEAPRALQDAPRCVQSPQDRPNDSQKSPKRLQEISKRLQDRLKRPHDRPKMSQDRHKIASKRSRRPRKHHPSLRTGSGGMHVATESAARPCGAEQSVLDRTPKSVLCGALIRLRHLQISKSEFLAPPIIPPGGHCIPPDRPK